ncbi:hypothetical protein MJ904_11500 [Massilia sp. MB5]|uniref:hypothetical protein n=1 Tax=unclassified Massilia TaxID=2609279 RepID=UPI00067B7F82|nr:MULTISPECIES: hypothetical protein [unclassified Massilia]AKU22488.1 hypothetical protein ACZ75_14430 [Massilia sp. NR 4-1]UMR32727.1 hypothetical protein MJ904_11500 [Massilia sp. MB5]
MMLKKLGFFFFACAAASSYAMADGSEAECREQCLIERNACMESNPRPSVCFTPYRVCINKCRGVGI